MYFLVNDSQMKWSFYVLPFSGSHGESRSLVILHFFCVTDLMPALYKRFANPFNIIVGH